MRLEIAEVWKQCRIEELNQAVQLESIELHRRSGQEQKVRCASARVIAQVLSKAVEVGRAVSTVAFPRTPGVMRFVDDDQVPASERDLLAPVLVPSGKRTRADNVVVERPHVVARVVRAQVVDGALGVSREDKIELRLELELPLRDDVRRREDQHPRRDTARFEFLDNERRLNRLTETNLVGQQEAMWKRRADAMDD